MSALSITNLKDLVINYNQGSEGLSKWHLNALHSSKENYYVDDDENRLHKGLLHEVSPQSVENMTSDYFIQALYSVNDFFAAYYQSRTLFDLEEKLNKVSRLKTKKLL